MLNNSILVTVAMPIYNPTNDIIISIKSILLQDHYNLEFIIIDDGSTTNSYRYIRLFNDNRIKYIYHKVNMGLAYRLNECIDMARGTYFCRMDQDDISYQCRISSQLSFMINNPQVDLLGCKYIAFNKNKKPIFISNLETYHVDICKNPIKTINIPHPTWFASIIWFKNNKYTTPGSYLSEDHEFLLSTFQNSRFHILNEQVLFGYQINFSFLKSIMTRFTILRLQHKYKLISFPFFKPLIYLIIKIIYDFFIRKFLRISNSYFINKNNSNEVIRFYDVLHHISRNI